MLAKVLVMVQDLKPVASFLVRLPFGDLLVTGFPSFIEIETEPLPSLPGKTGGLSKFSYQNIRRLKVPMDYTFLMNMLNRPAPAYRDEDALPC
jgi:hypothetical protein